MRLQCGYNAAMYRQSNAVKLLAQGTMLSARGRAVGIGVGQGAQHRIDRLQHWRTAPQPVRGPYAAGGVRGGWGRWGGSTRAEPRYTLQLV